MYVDSSTSITAALTFVVMSILILIMGGSDSTHSHGYFSTIDIPVISIIWNYKRSVPQEMSDRIVTPTERNLTTHRRQYRTRRVTVTLALPS